MNPSINLRTIAMTKKANTTVATDVPVTNNMKPHTEGEDPEPTRKDLMKHEAGEEVGASQNDGTTGGRIRDTKARPPNYQLRLFTHALWAVVASLLLVFAVNQFKPAMVKEPCPHTSPVQEDQGATPTPTILSQNTNSSPHFFIIPAPVFVEQCGISPPDEFIISIVSSACSCLIVTSTKTVETVTVTKVCRSSTGISKGLLTMSYRRQRSR